MRYVITLFWAVCLGQLVGFLGGALTSTEYNFVWTLFFSILVAVLVIIIDKVITPKQKTSQS
jgi:Protein of unknown function (DUF2929).